MTMAQEHGRLAGRTAVITGAASGIGAATSELFVAHGANVVLADIDADAGEALAATLGDAAVFTRCDVKVEGDIEAAVALATERYGRLDIMFNNAGAPGINTEIVDLDAAGIADTLALLLTGVILGIKHAARVMLAQEPSEAGERGSILSTASVAGISGGLGPQVYSAAKAAVVHLTETTSLDLGEHGIRVNCICPGGIVTNIFGAAYGVTGDRDKAIMRQMMRNGMAEIQAIKKAGEAIDIANAALFLSSDEAGFVNGHALVVDGGLTKGRTKSENEARQAARAGAVAARNPQD